MTPHSFDGVSPGTVPAGRRAFSPRAHRGYTAGALTRSRVVATALVALGLAYAASALAAFPRWTVDDAFITYRYAENLARTGELTWNVGEPPVEGYTGVALPVVLAGAVRAGIEPDVAAKCLGVSAFLVGALALSSLLGRFGVRPAVRGAVTLVFLTTPALFTHALSGLETTTFLACVVVALRAAAEGLDADGPSDGVVALTALALLAAGLVRPEGVALALALVPAYLLAGPRTGIARVRAAGVLGACYGVPAATYFAWRLAYYGWPLPNTYYAKWHAGFVPASFEDFARFVALFVALPALAAAALLAAAAVERGAVRAAAAEHATLHARERRLARGVLLPAVVFAVVCVVVYLRSALMMDFSARFFVPLAPVALLCAAVAAERALRRLEGGGRRGVRIAAVGIAATIAGAQVVANVALLRRETAFATSTRTLLEHEHVPIGRFLRDVVPADEWLAVVVDAGAIPYFSGLKTVDFGGLNDPYLGRRFVDRRSPADVTNYFFARCPGAAVFTSRVPDRIEGPEPAPIPSDPRFADYVRVATYGAPGWPEYYELVYLRRDIARERGLGALE